MGFYTLSHGKFHDRGYSDILYEINSIDRMLYSRTLGNHNHIVITLCYYPDLVGKSHWNGVKSSFPTKF